MPCYVWNATPPARFNRRKIWLQLPRWVFAAKRSKHCQRQPIYAHDTRARIRFSGRNPDYHQRWKNNEVKSAGSRSRNDRRSSPALFQPSSSPKISPHRRNRSCPYSALSHFGCAGASTCRFDFSEGRTPGLAIAFGQKRQRYFRASRCTARTAPGALRR